ncbi:hypothetical protein L596_015121 [Steinernema carpocapsae]|uniref:Uncharacterized protein n=1 Tax=Steinernema carpocapsae TaxID=34508 RepID=A0A4U5NEY0_STECR|nr:hypothetical protein L596_015121 [Steinernema carpocapsae]
MSAESKKQKTSVSEGAKRMASWERWATAEIDVAVDEVYVLFMKSHLPFPPVVVYEMCTETAKENDK